jgi:hypothetical protein
MESVCKPDSLRDLHLASRRTVREGYLPMALVVENLEYFCQKKYFSGLLRSPSVFQTEHRAKPISGKEKENNAKLFSFENCDKFQFNSQGSRYSYTGQSVIQNRKLINCFEGLNMQISKTYAEPL